MIRILIVDDQNLIRQGIQVLLEQSTDIETVGAVQDGETALQSIETLMPDVVLLDIDLPDIDGLIVAQKIHHKFPQVKVIMLSSFEDESYVSKATESGAKGYLLKNVSAEELEWSIKLVYQGYSAFKSELLSNLAPQKKSESLANPVSTTFSDKPVQEKDDVAPQAKTPDSATTATPDQLAVANRSALLARKHMQQKYSKYYGYSQQYQDNGSSYNPKLNRLKKTIKSFEFKLLIFIILFSLGFLVFVALS